LDRNSSRIKKRLQLGHRPKKTPPGKMCAFRERGGPPMQLHRRRACRKATMKLQWGDGTREKHEKYGRSTKSEIALRKEKNSQK